MIISRNDSSKPAKGWYTEFFEYPQLPAIGYANQGINERHYHQQMHEIYLVARGSSQIEVNREEITLQAGDVIVVEPGEIHTFTESTPDYFHFVLNTPLIRGDKVLVSEENT